MLRNLVLLAFAASLAAVAKPAPLTVKEVSLMLRSGYSASAVQAELARRYFIDSVDAAAEKTLVASGATPALVAELKSGAYAVPQEKVAEAQAELEAQAKRKAAQAEQARKFNTLYQHQLAETRAAATPVPAPMSHVVAGMVKGDLVTSRNGTLSVFNDQPLENKKLIGLYFSGKWCPACRKFTPELVQYYNRVAAAQPEFEIIFVSSDRSPAAMEAYMRDAQMPWPAVRYEKILEKEALRKYAGAGIPCLVIVDPSGKVVSDSYAGTTYRGPTKVLEDLERIFGAAPAGQVALQR